MAFYFPVSTQNFPLLPWGLEERLLKGGNIFLAPNEWIRREKGKGIGTGTK